MLLNDGRLVINLLVQSINGNDLIIYENGNKKRSVCFADDLIDGLTLFMNSSNLGPINLGNPKELFSLQIINLIRNISIEKVNK
ncbi:dTDP-glucose 4,6-dehydratase [Prochlorococcus sp. MIT 0801]|nr:dTDP-glucose 4,6-dehydratase [Prochlorococcus sp. MIT 0801]